MSSRFLHNGPPRGFEFKPDIIAAIKNAGSVDIAVSYLQMSGWFMLQRDLKRIPPAQIRIITTDQMNITQPAVLRAALHLGIQIKCYCGSRVFHPKVYVFHGIKKSRNLAILGSANISASGLENGVEAGIRTSDPALFKRLTRWFDNLFRDPAAQNIDEAFVKDYEKRWKRAAQTRVQLRRVATVRTKSRVTPTPEDSDTLDDVFSTISLPVGTLGFDHAGNNIRNLARLLDVLARYPKISYKEKSELRLLGFMHAGKLTSLGVRAKRCRTATAAAKVWCSWVKGTPDALLSALNEHLTSFKRAANRFLRLKAEVRTYFLRELGNSDERETLQAIELCCNGSTVVESLSINDFKTMAPFMLSRQGLSEFIEHAVADYLGNKGGRSWTSDDRRTVLNAWR
jgi:HKD family nuclease